ncbi:surface antigen (D15) [Spiribacter salinus M19-40]|uniref:Outer membrane protein assembly factor BamA n=1 Tax=Spiribacter salinus M19-40 TaxID=1260251 RepID=R4VFF7_9GAMM|nr:outer membrane protein assembly factor BamA [Spiribacter salinus]AGM40986.1 surface antigen (D15) [Spiribacter salinus M19-40]
MMRKKFAALFLMCGAGAAQGFTVEDIDIRGIERIAEGTVLNYLPLERGDEIDATASADAVESLFETGFFDDVQLLRDGDTLIIEVDERPGIAQIEFTGNDEIPGDRLRDGLSGAGLGEGQSFDPSLLSTIERELEQQYFALGYYDIDIESTVSPLPRNRVSLRLDIEEGEPASVQPIQFIGNQAFDGDTLRDEFEMGPRAWWAFLSDRDKYSRQRLSADLDRLQRFYRDRGYANFAIDSTQVAISPDRQRIHITVNLNEGQRYNVGEIELAGDLIFDEAELRELLTVKSGEVYNQRRIGETVDALRDKLGERGYAFARINPVPEIRAADEAVDLTFFVDPADRVYVRRVRISGNETTRDDVIRGEMRQFEGTWLSTSDLEESERRLGRTGFFGDVRVNTPRVPGTNNQVDVEVETTERLSGSLRAGVGFGSDQGVILNLGVQQDNVFGTGDRAEFVANSNDADTEYRLSYLERNHTLSGIDRRYAIAFRDREADEFDLNDYGLKSATASYGYRLPVSSNDRVGADLEFEETDIDLPADADSYLVDEIAREGRSNAVVRANISWTRDTRNRAVFPTQGGRQQSRLEVSLPGVSDFEYYRLSVDQTRYAALNERFTLMLDGTLSYGDGYGDSEILPFYENFYAGGIRTVRGYDRNSLGPTDDSDEQVGGNLRVLGRVEMQVRPSLDDDANNLRLSAFVDGGQVWDLEREGLGGFDQFDTADLRFSAGAGLTYYSPIGPLTMSLARPLNDEPGDETQFFQFTIGATF